MGTGWVVSLGQGHPWVDGGQWQGFVDIHGCMVGDVIRSGTPMGEGWVMSLGQGHP